MFFSHRKDTRKSLVVVAAQTHAYFRHPKNEIVDVSTYALDVVVKLSNKEAAIDDADVTRHRTCLLYTSPSPRDRQKSRMPSSA